MPDTANFGLTLLEASQAQKHVTVNEALVRLDALSQLVIVSKSELVPPVAPEDGAVYVVPAGAQAPWTNYVGHLAIFSNGGWVYVQPKTGWRCWVSELGVDAIFDGEDWRIAGGYTAPSGAETDFTPLEFTHSVTPGGTNATTGIIPANAVVFGVTGRVTSGLSGDLSAWRLGVAEDDARYGAGLGPEQNSYARGLSGTPLTYYSDTPLLLTAEGGEFVSGEVTLVVHLMRAGLPASV